MPATSFRFKQFVVHHDLCAMKVGTDGVLLGAWADCSDAGRILDVGTGSGLIALMMAQRSPEAFVHAIDIDSDACEQARINFESSIFQNRLAAFHSSLQDWKPEQKYDRIVSNPPFFVESLKSPDPQRSKARHADTLPFEELMERGASLLNPQGRLSLILPLDVMERITSSADSNGLFLSRRALVRPTADLAPKRVLLEYSTTPQTAEETDFFLEIARHQYSPEYIALTRDFYLKM